MDGPSSTAVRGARLLEDAQETNLDEVLNTLRAGTTKKTLRPKLVPLTPVNSLAARNFRATQSLPLAVTGRQLPLIYRLISALVSPPQRKTVLVVDTEHRFDATRLSCPDLEDVTHVYVHRPTRRIGPEQLRELVAAAEDWMVYGRHASGGREWWGTVVIGALGAGDVTAAWKGWLRIDRAAVPGFFVGCTAREALTDRSRRQEAVDAAPWAASSQWGDFTFTESFAAAESHAEEHGCEAEDHAAETQTR